MHAEQVTKLTLSRWFRLMHVNPIHAAGVQLAGGSVPDIQSRYCSQAWVQHSWQASDRIGREEIAYAIAEAEEQIENELKFRLLPTWEWDERVKQDQAWRPEAVGLGHLDVRGYHKTLRTQWREFIAGGIRATSTIEAGSAVVASDPDGDGFSELATVSVATTVTNEEEIRVFYPGHAGEDAWEIRPITVVISAGTATITFPRVQLVDPTLDERLVWDPVDGADDGNFLDTVDVVRVYHDPQTQISFLWEPVGTCDCLSDISGNSSCENCAFTTQTGCLLDRDRKLGIVAYQVGTWNSATEEFDAAEWLRTRDPDQARLFYRAGWRDQSLATPTLTMATKWENAVARLAAARLDRPGCQCSQDTIERWQRDRAYMTGAGEWASFKISKEDLGNPFGTKAGELFAWKQVERQFGTAAPSVVTSL